MEGNMENPLLKNTLGQMGFKENDIPVLKDVLSFIHDNNITSREMSHAYNIAMGLSAQELETSEVPRNEVFELAQKFDQSMQAGLPANSITALIEERRDHEDAPSSYSLFIDKLKASPLDKKILKSIVEDQTPGVLTILDAKTGDMIRKVRIGDLMNDDRHQRLLSRNLSRFLFPAKDREIKIKFESGRG